MNNSRTLAATIAGAVIGGAVGYLFFTEPGRNVRRQIEPALDAFWRELISVRNTLQMAAEVANGSWKLFTDTFGEGGTPPARSPGGRTFPV